MSQVASAEFAQGTSEPPAAGPPSTVGVAGRKASRAFLLSFLGSLVLVAAINFLGNGDGIFPSPVCLSESVPAWKTRRLEALAGTAAAPQALILGWSRGLSISPDQVETITGKRCFNYAVAGDSLSECHLQLQYALRAGIKPELLIITVDEGMFFPMPINSKLRFAGHAGLFRLLSLREKTRVIVTIIRGIDVASTLRSLERLVREPWFNDPPVIAIERRIYFTKGRRVHPEEQAQAIEFQQQAEREAAQPQTQKAADKAKRQSEFDRRHVADLRALCDLARQNKMTVHVLITPIMPLEGSHDGWKLRQRFLTPLRQLLESECESRGFRLHDFSSLDSFGGDPRQFYDLSHQSSQNVRRMTNVMLGRPAEDDTEPFPDEMELYHDVVRRFGAIKGYELVGSADE